MTNRTNNKKSGISVLIVALAMLLSSCVDETALRHDATADGKTPFMLTLTLVTATNDGSRAGHNDSYEEQGSDVENMINFGANDVHIVIFDNDGNYLYDFTPRSSDWSDMGSSAGYQGYKWEGKLSFPALADIDQAEKIAKNGFQVLVVANWNSFDNKSTYNDIFRKGDVHSSLAEIWNDGSNYNFDYVVSGVSSTWRPTVSGTTKSLIPMFGIAQSTPFAEKPDGDGRRYAFASISMQRAVAKVEIIDDLADQDITITDAVLTRYNTSGRYITDVANNPNWDKLGSQVEVSSLPDDVTTGSSLRFFREQMDATHYRWVAYVPEMLLEQPVVDAKGNFAGGRTHVDVTVSADKTGYNGGTYQVHFAQYDNNSKPTIPDPSWNHILRNHIYRFYIRHVNLGAQANIHLHVIPWNVDDEEIWDFTDNIAVTKNLTWVKGTYDDEIDQAGNVNLTFDPDIILEGHFRIISPVNGKWHAYLNMLPGSKSDAMTFVDEEGNPLPTDDPNTKYCLHAQGDITGNEHDMVLRIMPTNYENDSESRYRLEIYVENLGKWQKVALVEGDDFEDYIIVRKSNLIQ